MRIRNMARCALFAALLAICAWISVPVADVAFTLQTLGVALALWLLGGKRGTLSVLVYLLLGVAGLPVFSGFQGGVGALLGATGGYLTGFLLWALIYWLATWALPKNPWWQVCAMVLGLLSCYGFGTAWFCRLYLLSGSHLSVGFVLLKCVVPYLLPDALKLLIAWVLSRRLKRFVY